MIAKKSGCLSEFFSEENDCPGYFRVMPNTFYSSVLFVEEFWFSNYIVMNTRSTLFYLGRSRLLNIHRSIPGSTRPQRMRDSQAISSKPKASSETQAPLVGAGKSLKYFLARSDPSPPQQTAPGSPRMSQKMS